MHSTQPATPPPPAQTGTSRARIGCTEPTRLEIVPATSPTDMAGNTVAHAEESVFNADGEPTATTLLMLRLMGAGATERVIARELGTSVRTLQRRIARLQELVKAYSRFQLGVVAATRGWVESA